MRNENGRRIEYWIMGMLQTSIILLITYVLNGIDSRLEAISQKQQSIIERLAVIESTTNTYEKEIERLNEIIKRQSTNP